MRTTWQALSFSIIYPLWRGRYEWLKTGTWRGISRWVLQHQDFTREGVGRAKRETWLHRWQSLPSGASRLNYHIHSSFFPYVDMLCNTRISTYQNTGSLNIPTNKSGGLEKEVEDKVFTVVWNIQFWESWLCCAVQQHYTVVRLED